MNFARFIIFCFANICILFSETTNKIYVTLQGINKVGILYDDTMDTSTIDIDYDLDGEAGQDSPHFIVIDKEMVGNMPALMVLNTDKEQLYVSIMMSMVASGGGM